MARLKSMAPALSAAPARLVGPVDTGTKERPAWYQSARWQRLRRKVLIRDEYRCRQTGVRLTDGRQAPNSAVVDHINPHRWNPDLFWDEDNLQAVSKQWHDSEKQKLEKRGLA